MLVADLSGRRLGTGTAGGGNPVARGESTARANIAGAVDQACATVDASRIGAVIMGIAGVSTLESKSGQTLFDSVWERAGLSCQVRLVPDATVAFTAATPEPDGTVLIAGTGAIACGITDWCLSGARADGYGWLLGDLGSGSWLGKQAVYAALQFAAGHARGGPLVESVLAEITPHAKVVTVNEIIGAVMAREPVALSRLAPLVTAAADAGDPIAEAIVDESVAHLVSAVASVRTATDATPIAIAGSLAVNDTAVSRRLRSTLAQRFPGCPVYVGRDGAAGAAWLAARELSHDEALLRRLHAELTALR